MPVPENNTRAYMSWPARVVGQRCKYIHQPSLSCIKSVAFYCVCVISASEYSEDGYDAD